MNPVLMSTVCSRSEGYCWCVDPLTGRPIPGTSTRQGQPTCHVTQTGSDVTAPQTGSVQASWRKCEGRKREVFLARLFAWMSVSVANTSLAARVPYRLNSEPDLSINQRLAKWQFIALDVNRNGVCVHNYFSKDSWSFISLLEA